jgi:hypothetical protein
MLVLDAPATKFSPNGIIDLAPFVDVVLGISINDEQIFLLAVITCLAECIATR